jgi:cytochrome c biogenesis protein CcmG/thiol:disulfide interchange protein DsbE
MSAVQLRYMLPLSLFVVLAVGLGVGLTRDPSQIPSVLIDQDVPQFSLGPVEGRARGLASADLEGEVRLVNFFASWCVACRVEHPLLNRLTEDGTVPVYGINYRDKPHDARRWLDRMGDPYVRSGADLDGRVGIDWGVYGLPETFVIDRDGRIVYKHIGPIRPEDLEQTILPLIEELRG